MMGQAYIRIINLALALLIVVTMVLGLKLGIVDISFDELVRIVFAPGQNDVEPYLADIVWDLRFPRVFLALAIGMGLSLSGMVMQAAVKNPLADPYIWLYCTKCG